MGSEEAIESSDSAPNAVYPQTQNAVLFVSHLPISSTPNRECLTARLQPVPQPTVQHLLVLRRGAAREDNVTLVVPPHRQEQRPLQSAHPVRAHGASHEGAGHERRPVPRTDDARAVLHDQLRGPRQRQHLSLHSRPH